MYLTESTATVVLLDVTWLMAVFCIIPAALLCRENLLIVHLTNTSPSKYQLILLNIRILKDDNVTLST